MRDDLDLIAERLAPFAMREETREETRERLKDLAVEYRQRLTNLEGLLSSKRLGCPVCMNAYHVIGVGNGRGDTKNSSVEHTTIHP